MNKIPPPPKPSSGPAPWCMFVCAVFSISIQCAQFDITNICVWFFPAFAELQIEMTDLTTDMSAASIPYLRFEAYAMRVLFPSVDTHPIMEMDVCTFH